MHRVVVLDDPRWWRSVVSNTFHGRDILTPVAAAWSLGHDISEFELFAGDFFSSVFLSHLRGSRYAADAERCPGAGDRRRSCSGELDHEHGNYGFARRYPIVL